MKKNENSIIQQTKYQVDFFLCRKIDWQVEEVFLFKQEFRQFSRLKNESRKNEFLGVRSLRNNFDKSLEIAYSNNRKPFFINSPLHLSISHSKNYIAIAVAPYPIGMDIEECHDRIFKVSNRFLNQSEKELFNHESSRDLTFAWSAKEALFKLNVNVGLDFKSDLIITDWDKKSMIRARMIENSEWRNVNLHSMMHENLVICFNFE